MLTFAQENEPNVFEVGKNCGNGACTVIFLLFIAREGSVRQIKIEKNTDQCEHQRFGKSGQMKLHSYGMVGLKGRRTAFARFY